MQNVKEVSIRRSGSFENETKHFGEIKALVSSSPITQAKDVIDAIAKLMAGEELPDETLSHGTLLTQESIKDFDWRSVVEARSN